MAVDGNEEAGACIGVTGAEKQLNWGGEWPACLRLLWY